jgi:hypothetical protein
MMKRGAKKKAAPPFGSEGGNTDCAKPPQTQPQNQLSAKTEKDSYRRSRQLFKDYEKNLRGWMVRDARSELDRAINHCTQNVINHVEENKIPSEQLPVALRDPTTSKEFVKSFGGCCMIESLMDWLIRAAREKDIESVEVLCSVAYETCAALRDIITKHSGTDAQRERLAEIARVNSAFPLLVRMHTKANKDAVQALQRMGLGEKSWIDTDASKKYGVDSQLNRYLVRLIPHLQRFCEIDVQGPVHQNSLFALPMLERLFETRTGSKRFRQRKATFSKNRSTA